MPNTEFGFNTPFKEQLDFFRQKVNLPSERWDDIIKEAHDKAFIVAGAANADLLQDLRNAIDKAIAEGKGLDAFRKDFKAIVKKHGWVNYTGSGSAEGIAWRTKVIYQTNMSTSYAAGRYKQLTDPDYLKLRPNWKYVHSDSVMHPRPLHKSWDGLVLSHDHVFWKTHFAPNGWGCQCRIVPARTGEKVTEPPKGWDKLDPKTGAPVGIDRGFDYAPGASVKKPLQSFIDDKLIKQDGAIGAAMWQVLKPALRSEMQADVKKMVGLVAETMQSTGESVMVHVISPAVVANADELGVTFSDASIWLRDEQVLHAIRDAKTNANKALPVDVWLNLPTFLDSANVYYDKHKQNLVYVFDFKNEQGKVAKVAVNVNLKKDIRLSGQRKKVKSNFIATGGKDEGYDFSNNKRYMPLSK